MAPDVIAGVVKTGKAKLDLRLWAILGPNSEAAHRAGYAAMQQNKLWLYATIVYYNQGNEADNWFDDAFARSVAVAAGLDLKKFDADRKSAAADQMIQAVEADAQAHGLTGTPTIGVAKGGGPSRRSSTACRPPHDIATAADDRRGVKGSAASRADRARGWRAGDGDRRLPDLRALARPAPAVPGRRRRLRDRAAQPLRRAGRASRSRARHARRAGAARIAVPAHGVRRRSSTFAIAFAGALFSGYLTRSRASSSTRGAPGA